MSEMQTSNAVLVGQDEAEVRLRADGEALVAQVRDMTIDDDDSFVVGTELLASIKRSARAAQSFIQPIVDKAHDNGIIILGDNKATKCTPAIWRNKVRSCGANGILV